MHGTIAVAKRKKLKSPPAMGLPDNIPIHDRRTTDSIAAAALAMPVIVDDPMGLEPGDKIVVMRSTRDDPLAAMHAANQIDEVQYAAGRVWQRSAELAQLGGLRGIDLTQEAVDGGEIAQATLSEPQIKAFEKLAEARRALGWWGEALVRDILVSHLTIAQASEKRGLFGRENRLRIGWQFRQQLDVLAEIFGLAMRRRAT